MTFGGRAPGADHRARAGAQPDESRVERVADDAEAAQVPARLRSCQERTGRHIVSSI